MDELMNEKGFDDLDNPAEAETAVEEVDVKKAKKTKDPFVAKIQDDFIQKLQEKPEMADVISSKSKDIEVVNTITFGSVKEGASPRRKEDGTGLYSVPKIHGCVIVNKGKDPIVINVDTYDRKNVDAKTGKFIPTETAITIAPGAQQELRMSDLTILGSRPEYSFLFANGGMIKSSTIVKEPKDIIDAFYFAFERGENGKSTKDVHDDAIKINIGKKVTNKVDGKSKTKWVVSDKYFRIFGYLENQNVKRAKPQVQVKRASLADFVFEISKASKAGK